MDYHLKLKQWLPGGREIGQSLKETFDSVVSVVGFHDHGETETDGVRRAATSLVRHLLQRDGKIPENRKEVYQRLLGDRYEQSEAERKLRELSRMEPMALDDAATLLAAKLPDAEPRRQMYTFLLALAVELGESEQDIALVRKIAFHFSIPETEFNAERERLSEENRRRRMIISSGWGIIAALVLIFVFVLTATLLQSVIFGLIIAAVLLPLEKHFEKKLRQKRGLSYRFVAAIDFLLLPLQRFSKAITRKKPDWEANEEDRQSAAQKRLVKKATGLAAFSAFVALLLVVSGLSVLTGRYMAGFQQNIRQKWDASQNSQSTLISRSTMALEKLRSRFENQPLVRSGLDRVEQFLKDPEAQSQALQTVLRHSGGFFSFTGNVFGTLCSFFGNLLLTIFFALLFLYQLAGACGSGSSDKQKSSYLLRTVFSGIWLPHMNEDVLAEAGRIIEGIFFRLKVWLKGYITLILIDSTFYVTALFFLGVPYFLPLGLFSGWGIALPYLGPVITCGTTLLVVLASGGSTVLLLKVIVCYLIYNGIVEQFILYPAVIGEALGLSTLETIIVVLLGAIFAGIPGMLFALPIASVAKYIIPQIYRSFFHPKKI